MRKKALPRTVPTSRSNGTRITVTVPPQDYEVVRSMAKDRKVSAAWIVRDAVEKYIQRETPSPL
jgi:predicted transcriptional regulator